MEDKYYTPDIEDIRIGFEYESLQDERMPEKPESWERNTIETVSDLITFLTYYRGDHFAGLRVPYLTNIQIEGEGWKFKAKSVDIWFEREGNFRIDNWTSYKLLMHYGSKYHIGNTDCRLHIIAIDQDTEHKLFEGYCSSINEFRTICTLVGI